MLFTFVLAENAQAQLIKKVYNPNDRVEVYDSYDLKWKNGTYVRFDDCQGGGEKCHYVDTDDGFKLGLSNHNEIKLIGGDQPRNIVRLTSLPAPNIPSAVKADMLANHNRVRRAEGSTNGIALKDLEWSDELAAGAYRWAMAMDFIGVQRHEKELIGWENLAPTQSANFGFEAWENERSAYYNSGGFNGCRGNNNCGHYKNLVDPHITQVGCAVSNGYTVCRYGKSPGAMRASENPELTKNGVILN